MDGGGPPGLLNEAGAAHLTLRATRVVLAATQQLELVLRVRLVTQGRVPVTHASTTDRDVLDTVVVLQEMSTEMSLIL